jgi:hypothetical protein
MDIALYYYLTRNILNGKVDNDNGDQISEGSNQILEILNAKGDTGELNNIVERSNNDFDKSKSDTKS